MDKLTDSFKWLEIETPKIQFGVIALSATIHAGKIVRVERSVTHKLQIDNKSEAKCKQD